VEFPRAKKEREATEHLEARQGNNVKGQHVTGETGEISLVSV